MKQCDASKSKQVTTDGPADSLPLARIRCKINGGMGILRINEEFWLEWEIPRSKYGGNEKSGEK